MTDPVTVPSTPDPATVTLVASLLRHVLTLLSGLGIGVGAYSDSTLTIIASALVGIVGIGWALWQKYQAARQAHSSAVQSSIAGTPVKAAA